MALDGGTIASIAFGGAITVLTTLSGVAFKEWVDRRREARADDAELKAAARRAWSLVSNGSAYFAISAFYGQWATTGSAVATTLPIEDARLLSREEAAWQAMHNALQAFTLALDARAASPDKAIPEQSKALVFAAVTTSMKAARTLADLGGLTDQPETTDEDAAFLRKLFGDQAEDFIAMTDQLKGT